RLRIYYGAADTCIAMAEARLEDLVQLCLQESLPSHTSG
ncbi:MAG: hypothetical protein JG766_2730, partial [Desulfacinum sp.]|nr:hypothetical protein [Desulfacinum sp.]